jgi:Mg/Co/Ni transporter MgtE
MTDVILTSEQYEALKAVCERANALVIALPYITMMGGNVTRQNINVQALATALEAAKGVDFENVRQLEGVDHAAPIVKRTRTTKG